MKYFSPWAETNNRNLSYTTKNFLNLKKGKFIGIKKWGMVMMNSDDERWLLDVWNQIMHFKKSSIILHFQCLVWIQNKTVFKSSSLSENTNNKFCMKYGQYILLECPLRQNQLKVVARFINIIWKSKQHITFRWNK